MTPNIHRHHPRRLKQPSPGTRRTSPQEKFQSAPMARPELIKDLHSSTRNKEAKKGLWSEEILIVFCQDSFLSTIIPPPQKKTFELFRPLYTPLNPKPSTLHPYTTIRSGIHSLPLWNGQWRLAANRKPDEMCQVQNLLGNIPIYVYIYIYIPLKGIV